MPAPGSRIQKSYQGVAELLDGDTVGVGLLSMVYKPYEALASHRPAGLNT